MILNGVNFDTYFNEYPDKDGYFGKYGGVYIDDKLKAAMAEITEAYYSICQSRKFIADSAKLRDKLSGLADRIVSLCYLRHSCFELIVNVNAAVFAKIAVFVGIIIKICIKINSVKFHFFVLQTINFL